MFFPDFPEKNLAFPPKKILAGLGLLPLAPWPTVRDLAGHQPIGVPGALHPCRAGLLRFVPPWLKMVMPVTEEVILDGKMGVQQGDKWIKSWDFGDLSGILRFSWILNGLEMDFVSKNEGSSREKVWVNQEMWSFGSQGKVGTFSFEKHAKSMEEMISIHSSWWLNGYGSRLRQWINEPINEQIKQSLYFVFWWHRYLICK